MRQRSRIGARKPPSVGKALRAYAQVAAGTPVDKAYADPPKPREPGESYIVREPAEQPQRTAATLPAGVSGRILRRR